MPIIAKIQKSCRPIWQYLNQPIFDSNCQSIWTPSRFWHSYQVKLLERCWRKDSTSESHPRK